MNEIPWGTTIFMTNKKPISPRIKSKQTESQLKVKISIPKNLRTFRNFLPEAPEEVYGASRESFRSLWKKITKRLLKIYGAPVESLVFKCLVLDNGFLMIFGRKMLQNSTKLEDFLTSSPFDSVEWFLVRQNRKASFPFFPHFLTISSLAETPINTGVLKGLVTK